MSDNKYHDHLDVCAQCREHPFDLCEDGWRILNAEIGAHGSAPALALLNDIAEERMRGRR